MINGPLAATSLRTTFTTRQEAALMAEMTQTTARLIESGRTATGFPNQAPRRGRKPEPTRRVANQHVQPRHHLRIPGRR
ncbi:hypothetical protein HLB23_32945 [Nocardia uniformis]|uniref:Uncharacterized protein n=1 Tax=Nocardia uniformis TaxID=53432 RepID=A0A849C7M5_9NOCA|nr:hypothetical protein [Nocardia uniformis]NNH74602.1 hypothetical protein [Nocardia uniformis]